MRLGPLFVAFWSGREGLARLRVFVLQVRILGWGVLARTTRPLFSEREGIVRPWIRIGRFRVFGLAPRRIL